ncbi:hypothetical protein RQN30_10650 [Arcanobacterium hippocoleae]
MDIYVLKVNFAVKQFVRNTGISSSKLARQLGIKPSTFYARMCGARPWRVDELARLADIGVQVPSFNFSMKVHKEQL